LAGPGPGDLWSPRKGQHDVPEGEGNSGQLIFRCKKAAMGVGGDGQRKARQGEAEPKESHLPEHGF
jgi:hypothetical protein